MNEKEFTLHRYFIWADAMRSHFDREVTKRQDSASKEHELGVEEFMYMSLWYAQLYTVIEGWHETKQKDSKVDELLNQTDNISLLRRYRNGTAHFQKDYFDSRFTNFVSKDGSTLWIRESHEALSNYFLQRLELRSS
jgi:hypothetical protein